MEIDLQFYEKTNKLIEHLPCIWAKITLMNEENECVGCIYQKQIIILFEAGTDFEENIFSKFFLIFPGFIKYSPNIDPWCNLVCLREKNTWNF